MGISGTAVRALTREIVYHATRGHSLIVLLVALVVLASFTYVVKKTRSR
jgi:hypothetical protein